ncbi:MAG TPA: hypothetical protein VFK02_00880 [Kofleriaceae bacterium]|nr:hypothetical protein [Kofleriaceae bacterium]
MISRAGLLAACVAVWGCAGSSETQVVTGQISARSAAAVRAVDDQDVVTAAQVRSDGTFTLTLPTGNRYRVEVLTAAGVKHLYVHGPTGLHDLAFKVCKPGAPWDVGVLRPPSGDGKGTCDPSSDPTCKCDPYGKCDDGGGGGGGTGCDPKLDPNCKCDPYGKCDDGSGGGGGTGCDPKTDPNCKCDPYGNCEDGGGGGGTGCDPKLDPDCKCDPSGKCVDGCLDPGDPSCKPMCDDPTGKYCEPPPPPCKDPSDPNTCKDKCAIDPVGCGCPFGDPGCWGDPYPPKCDANGNCSAEGALMPEHPPGDFGCQESY